MTYYPIIDGDYIMHSIAHVFNETYCASIKDVSKLNSIKLSISAALKNKIKDIVNYCESDRYILFIGGKSPYRKLIEPLYKNKRSTPPEVISEVKQIMLDECKATLVDKIETDDAVSITFQYYNDKYKINSVKPCIVSPDKDLKQNIGFVVSPPLWNKKVYDLNYITKEEATLNLYKQLLKGDSVDNIAGLKGVGDKKADDFLKENNNTINDILELYIEQEKDEVKGVYNFAKTFLLVYLLKEYEGFEIPKFKKLEF